VVLSVSNFETLLIYKIKKREERELITKKIALKRKTVFHELQGEEMRHFATSL
jgi:hypothetical protein